VPILIIASSATPTFDLTDTKSLQQGVSNAVVITIRLRFDCNSTALRPFDDLRGLQC